MVSTLYTFHFYITCDFSELNYVQLTILERWMYLQVKFCSSISIKQYDHFVEFDTIILGPAAMTY